MKAAKETEQMETNHKTEEELQAIFAAINDAIAGPRELWATVALIKKYFAGEGDMWPLAILTPGKYDKGNYTHVWIDSYQPGGYDFDESDGAIEVVDRTTSYEDSADRQKLVALLIVGDHRMTGNCNPMYSADDILEYAAKCAQHRAENGCYTRASYAAEKAERERLDAAYKASAAYAAKQARSASAKKAAETRKRKKAEAEAAKAAAPVAEEKTAYAHVAHHDGVTYVMPYRPAKANHPHRCGPEGMTKMLLRPLWAIGGNQARVINLLLRVAKMVKRRGYDRMQVVQGTGYGDGYVAKVDNVAREFVLDLNAPFSMGDNWKSLSTLLSPAEAAVEHTKVLVAANPDMHPVDAEVKAKGRLGQLADLRDMYDSPDERDIAELERMFGL
jgi:hypothetical protein